MGGYSTPGGFWVYGDMPSDDVTDAAQDALERLKAGESRLAISAYCGTNLAVGIAGAVLLAGLIRKRVTSRAARVPLVAGAVLGALLARRTLGMAAQRELTTLSEVGDAEIQGVRRMGFGRHVLHRVEVGRSRWGRSSV